MVETVVSGVVTNALTKRGSSKAKKAAGMIVPKTINTGNSIYNTKEGTFELDPSIREMQDSVFGGLSGLKSDVTSAYDDYGSGIESFRGELSGLKGDYIGNQSAYRESMLNPLREQIAKREGSLNKELSRTGVRGSFADQARNNLAIDSGRALSDKEAQIENERIGKLSSFLGMDANLLQASLTSDTGRIKMLGQLEESLSGISMDRFNQEMEMLGLPAAFVGGNAQAAQMTSNAEGIRDQAMLGAFGDVLEGASDFFTDKPINPLEFMP